MKRRRGVVPGAFVAISGGLLAMGIVQPGEAHAYVVLRFDAPAFFSNPNTATAYMETGMGATRCNDPAKDPCGGTYLELQVYFQGGWTQNARANSPTSVVADGTRFWWKATGTCLTLLGNNTYQYRSYFQQTYRDQGSLYLHERMTSAIQTYTCNV